MIERPLLGNVAAAPADRHHQFELEVQAAGPGRIGNLAAFRHHRVRRLGKEEGRLALWVTPHLVRMRHIVPTDAVDAMNWKELLAAGDRQARLGWRLEDVALGHGGYLCAF